MPENGVLQRNITDVAWQLITPPHHDRRARSQRLRHLDLPMIDRTDAGADRSGGRIQRSGPRTTARSASGEPANDASSLNVIGFAGQRSRK